MATYSFIYFISPTTKTFSETNPIDSFIVVSSDPRQLKSILKLTAHGLTDVLQLVVSLFWYQSMLGKDGGLLGSNFIAFHLIFPGSTDLSDSHA